MDYHARELPFENEDEDTRPLAAIRNPMALNTANINPASGDVAQQAPHYAENEGYVEEGYVANDAPGQPQNSDEPGRRFSRRQILIAGGGAAGLVVATSLGIIELKNLLQSQGHPILGSLRLGNNAQQQQVTIPQPYTTPQDILIFSGQISSGWNDWSWGTRQIVPTPAFTDGSSVIKFTPSNWAGVYLSHTPLDTAGYGFFQFWINGGAVGGQQILAGMADVNHQFTPAVSINAYIQGNLVGVNQWQLVRIPMAAMQSADAKIGGVIIQDGSGTQQPDVFLADLRLLHLPNLSEPHLLSGAAPDLNAILVYFDRLMQPDEVQSPRFYQISSMQDRGYLSPVQPTKALYHAVNKSVSLYVPQAMKEGQQYVVSIGRIHSQDGPALADASSVTVTAQALELTVDASKRGPAISPYIYGVLAAPNNGYLSDLKPRLNRWGGESDSRYNWKLGNAWNATADYFYQNGNYGHTSYADRQPSGVADQFIQGNKDAGIDTILTIPTIGWVAKDDLATSASINVPWGGPPASPGSDDSIFQGVVYDPTANRRRTSVPSRARKGAPFSDPPDLGDPTVAQDEWVYHLTRRFGQSANGGVRFYAMDNEPELWCVLQRDVRPVTLSYDQELSIFLDYATAVKDVDPTALITGPVTWGWTNYFYSALDHGEGSDYKNPVDFHAHGDIPFLAWFLSQVRKHDEASGKRSLDVLDIHFFSPTPFYYRDQSDAKMSALRLRATRSLWDPTYKDESWINDYIQLIPRMQSWIANNYPGTKFGISEYSWGGEGSMNGALTEAEVLGIFGSRDVYMACYWPYPAANSPLYNAFKLYTNYDGQGGMFGGTSIYTASTQLETISCYAAEQENGDILLMVLNKDQTNALTPTISLPHLGTRRVTAYQYGPDASKPIAQTDSFILKDATLRYTFLPYSITLLKLQKG